MNNSCFVGGLYVATAVALLLTVSGVLLGVSMLTIIARAALAFATFAFLGWAAESILRQVPRVDMACGEEAEDRGLLVDVTLPATGNESQIQPRD